ncbi:MAG: hypothetical protein AAB434_05830 [Planctomycetota bacterium]
MPTIEKTVRVFRDFASAETADLDEWMALSGEERLAIGESLRLEAFGAVPPRLERVLVVAEREED